MKNTFIMALAGLMVVGSLASNANADLVSDGRALITNLADVVAGANNGGLDDTTLEQQTNGSDELKFRFVLDDSAGSTGSIFEAVVDFSTTDTEARVFANGTGRIPFGTGDNLFIENLSITLDSVTVTSGTASASDLTLLGFGSVTVDQWAAGDSFGLGATTYDSSIPQGVIDTSADYGASIDLGGGAFRVTGFTLDFNATTAGGGILLGDCNQDGVVDFLDIAPFIAILSGDPFLAEADTDGDGEVTFLDIAPFITILAS